MRDPLSVSPVVLGESRLPGVMNQYFNQQIDLDRRRREEDANKVAILSKLSAVDAQGWEQDQRKIDEMKDEHQKMVTDIMVKADGKPDPQSLRRIQNSADMIKAVATKSVADRKEYDGWVGFLRNKMDKLEYDKAAAALEDNYKRKDVFTRGQFDMSPYVKETVVKPIDIFRPFASLSPAVTTTVFGKDGKRSLTQKADWGKLESAVKDMVAAGGTHQQAFEEAVKSGKVQDVDSFARMIVDNKKAQVDLRSEYTESESANSLEWRDNFQTGEGDLVSGWMLKKKASIPVDYNGTLVDFNPISVYTKDGEKYSEGTIKVKIPEVVISYDAYKQLVPSEQSKYVVDINKGGYKLLGSGGVEYKKHIIPYNEISDQFETQVKGEMKEGAPKTQPASKLPAWAVIKK